MSCCKNDIWSMNFKRWGLKWTPQDPKCKETEVFGHFWVHHNVSTLRDRINSLDINKSVTLNERNIVARSNVEYEGSSSRGLFPLGHYDHRICPQQLSITFVPSNSAHLTALTVKHWPSAELWELWINVCITHHNISWHRDYHI
jgi:hypothetical protein